MESSGSGKKVAIVGAGYTGLTTAYKLCQQGIDVTIYEAGDGAGGLAGGCRLLGVPVEKAYHFLYRTDRHMLRLLEELDLLEGLTYHRSSVSTYYDGKLYPMMGPLDLIKFTPLSMLNRIRAGLSVLYLQRVKNWKRLTSITAMEWLTKYAGKQVTDVIWSPLLKGKFDKYFDKITMCWLWGRIKQRVDSRDPQKGEVLGYIEGGFNALTDQLVSKIEQGGGRIRFNTRIDKLRHDPDTGKVGVLVEGQKKEFDRVLLTVPCKVADKMLDAYREIDPGYFQKLNSIDYLDAVILLFATDKPISNYYWHNINTPNSPFVVFLSLTSLIGTDRFNGKHVYYIGDYVPREHRYMNMSERDLVDTWFSSLKEMFPDFSTDSVLEKQLFRFKDAQHIVDVGFEDKIVDYETPCPGVYLCNFSQIFPMDRGTNYAVRDGYRMAELIGSGL